MLKSPTWLLPYPRTMTSRCWVPANLATLLTKALRQRYIARTLLKKPLVHYPLLVILAMFGRLLLGNKIMASPLLISEPLRSHPHMSLGKLKLCSSKDNIVGKQILLLGLAHRQTFNTSAVQGSRDAPVNLPLCQSWLPCKQPLLKSWQSCWMRQRLWGSH